MPLFFFHVEHSRCIAPSFHGKPIPGIRNKTNIEEEERKRIHVWRNGLLSSSSNYTVFLKNTKNNKKKPDTRLLLKHLVIIDPFSSLGE
jgi:hypothetical protein